MSTLVSSRWIKVPTMVLVSLVLVLFSRPAVALASPSDDLNALLTSPEYVALEQQARDLLASPVGQEALSAVIDLWKNAGDAGLVAANSTRSEVAAVLDRQLTQPYPAYLGNEHINEYVTAVNVLKTEPVFVELASLVVGLASSPLGYSLPARFSLLSTVLTVAGVVTAGVAVVACVATAPVCAGAIGIVGGAILTTAGAGVAVLAMTEAEIAATAREQALDYNFIIAEPLISALYIQQYEIAYIQARGTFMMGDALAASAYAEYYACNAVFGNPYFCGGPTP